MVRLLIKKENKTNCVWIELYNFNKENNNNIFSFKIYHIGPLKVYLQEYHLIVNLRLIDEEHDFSECFFLSWGNLIQSDSWILKLATIRFDRYVCLILMLLFVYFFVCSPRKKKKRKEKKARILSCFSLTQLVVLLLYGLY